MRLELLLHTLHTYICAVDRCLLLEIRVPRHILLLANWSNRGILGVVCDGLRRWRADTHVCIATGSRARTGARGVFSGTVAAPRVWTSRTVSHLHLMSARRLYGLEGTHLI